MPERKGNDSRGRRDDRGAPAKLLGGSRDGKIAVILQTTPQEIKRGHRAAVYEFGKAGVAISGDGIAAIPQSRADSVGHPGRIFGT